MGDSVQILGVRIDAVDAREALERVVRLASEDRTSYVVTPNVEIVMASRRDRRLGQALSGADLAVGDGVGLVWASRILRRPLPERVGGIDLMTSLLEQARKSGLRVYLLGSTPEVVAAAASRIRSDLGLSVVGYHDGYLTEETEAEVLRSILEARPHIIFVGMGSPRQELWMAEQANNIPRGVMMGVGGSLDVISGRKRRAPLFMRRLGLEWLYRLITEPRRFWRMTALPRFALLVLLVRLGIVRE